MLMIWNAVLKTQAVKILMREWKESKNLIKIMIIIVNMVNLIINRKINIMMIMMIMMIVMRVMKKSPVYRNLRKLINRNRK